MIAENGEGEKEGKGEGAQYYSFALPSGLPACDVQERD